ncbi:hypothetical protein [Streptomyces sp. NPDC001717]|uniref:hypothetical protein n=1 Tax=Streptomyces sp. NPDC001717 TaxID=3364604 RepID=UPI0036BED1A9
MNDHLDQHAEADDLLDELLFAHASELRETVGGVIDTEAGLANLNPFRQELAVCQSADAGVVGAVPAFSGPGARSHSRAVEVVVDALASEAVKVGVLHARLKGIPDRSLVTLTRRHFDQLIEHAYDYQMHLVWLHRVFTENIRVERDDVLASLATYMDALSLMKRYFEIQAKGRGLGGRRRTLWVKYAEELEERMGALSNLRGDIEWIFDASDDLQEVRF